MLVLALHLCRACWRWTWSRSWSSRWVSIRGCCRCRLCRSIRIGGKRSTLGRCSGSLRRHAREFGRSYRALRVCGYARHCLVSERWWTAQTTSSSVDEVGVCWSRARLDLSGNLRSRIRQGFIQVAAYGYLEEHRTMIRSLPGPLCFANVFVAFGCPSRKGNHSA